MTGIAPGAAQRLARFGPNAIAAEQHEHPLRVMLGKLWAPVPWMLEATILLELLLHKDIEAVVIGALLSLLRQRLAIQVRVRRDGDWRRIAAEGIVPDDVIYLRVGDIVPADVRVIGGGALVDHWTVTAESTPVDASAGAIACAGGIICRGEATAFVTQQAATLS